MPQGNKTLMKFTLNGKQVNAPVEWDTIETLSTFDSGAVQANISIDKFTFVNEEAQAIKQYIEDGLTGGYGIFRGMPIQLQVYNENNTVSIFDGLIDLTDGLEINEWQNKYKCKLRLKDELLTLEEQLTCLSYGYLESLGIFSSSDYTDVQYVVQQRINIMQTITTGIMIYILTKELIDITTVRVPKDFATAFSLVATGGFTSSIAGIIYKSAAAFIDITYAVLIVIAIIKCANIILDQLIPIKRKAKTLKMRTALEKVSGKIGLKFQSNISDLDDTYYLPSNFAWDTTNDLGILNNFKGTPKGIPNVTDYGYYCSEMFEIAKKLFNGKYAIINGNLCFYNVDDIFWVEQSTFKMPAVRDKIKTFNTSELQASILLSFEVDYTDEHTVSDYRGTSYQVITNALTPPYNPNVPDSYTFIKGLEEVRFGVCLASRKDKPYGVENLIKNLASTVDDIVNFFGGKSDYVSQIKTSVGLMVVSNNNYAKSKIIKLNKNKRLVDRNQWSAKYIYDTYYKGKSFIQSINGIANYGQKAQYKNVKIPFGMNNFLEIKDNSYFVTDNGSIGKIESCKWRTSADYATVDFFIREAYTNNLKETFIEPSNT